MSSPFVFIRKGFQSWNISIPESDSATILANGSSYIDFSHNIASGMANPECTFTTDHPVVIEFLHGWIKANPGKITIDTSMQPMKCPYCDFETEDGSDASMDIWRLHLVEHATQAAREADAPVDLRLSEPLEVLKNRAIEAGHDAETVHKLRSKKDVVELIDSQVNA